MKLLSKLFFVITVILTSCNSSSESPKVEALYRTLKFDSNKIEFMGRVGKTDSTSELYWSGSSIKVEFEGTEISATLQDDKGDNYFNIIIDNDSIYTLRPSVEKTTYKLADNLHKGKHTVQIFKRTEWPKGITSFYGFSFANDTKVNVIEDKILAIEFYGNSITSGYAVEDYSGNDSPDSIYTNSYNSYASVTARYFDADYTCISRGGIGIMVSWYPMIMPEMYYRFNPNDADSKWDFTKSNPDIVVINLFQNDSWLVEKPENDQFKNRFGKIKPTKEFIEKSYADFVMTIRKEYPSAEIICMLGNMDITEEGSPWPSYVKNAVASLEDDKVYTVFAPYKNTPGHPKIEEQLMIADALIASIEKIIK